MLWIIIDVEWSINYQLAICQTDINVVSFLNSILYPATVEKPTFHTVPELSKKLHVRWGIIVQINNNIEK
jgi:hypothetical protein